MVAVGINPWLVTSWRINHLGMKPVSGGRPPRERRIKQAIAARAGDLVQEEASVTVLVASMLLRVRKAAAVITIYVIKAIRVSWGAIWATRIIHPKWAMDEYARILRSCV